MPSVALRAATSSSVPSPSRSPAPMARQGAAAALSRSPAQVTPRLLPLSFIMTALEWAFLIATTSSTPSPSKSPAATPTQSELPTVPTLPEAIWDTAQVSPARATTKSLTPAAPIWRAPMISSRPLPSRLPTATARHGLAADDDRSPEPIATGVGPPRTTTFEWAFLTATISGPASPHRLPAAMPTQSLAAELALPEASSNDSSATESSGAGA